MTRCEQVQFLPRWQIVGHTFLRTAVNRGRRTSIYASRLSECLFVETDMLWLVFIHISIWLDGHPYPRSEAVTYWHESRIQMYLPHSWSIEHLYFHCQIRNFSRIRLRALIFRAALPPLTLTSTVCFHSYGLCPRLYSMDGI
jgi:hypothetical protein